MDLATTLSSAAADQAGGRLDDARLKCLQALQIDESSLQAKLLLGVVEVQAGHPDRAIGPLHEVLKGDETSFQAPFWLSVAYRTRGQAWLAVAAAERAFAVKPSDLQALLQLGLCYLDARLLPAAEARLRAAADLAPSVLQIQGSLSLCLELQGRKQEAEDVISEVIRRLPPNEDALLKFGLLSLGQANYLGAAMLGKRVVEISPRSFQARVLFARALIEGNRVQEAASQLRAAVELDPESAEARSLLGRTAQTLGDMEVADRFFEQSIALEPNQGAAYFALVFNRKVTEEDEPILCKMQELAEDASLPPQQLGNLHYGLGKSYEDLAKYEQSMKHFDRANEIEFQLKFGSGTFDRGEQALRTDRIEGQFRASTVQEYASRGSSDSLPIFVVGMLRSGTTLVEQILSSHPEIGGSGEQSFWSDNWREATVTGERVNPAALEPLGDRYCALLRVLAPGKSRVVDKHPGNAFGLGVIHMALPAARIIHVKRHPVDTCLSIYTTPNSSRAEFAHKRENIVFAYKQYLRIMQHWAQALPEESVLHVSYEELVTDGEPVIRRMIEFCSLQWNDSCLRPQDNIRSVSTPSVWQVRQPLYKSSMERWRRFEPWLGAFAELL